MKILRQLFFIRKIYSRKAAVAILLDGMIVLAIIVVVIYPFLLRYLSAQWAFLFLFIPTLWWTLRNIIKSTLALRLLKSKPSSLATIEDLSSILSSFSVSAPNDELNTVDQTTVVASGKDWQLYNAVFNFFRRTRYGDYLSKQVYYTTFEMKLERTVPHMIFDSKKAKGQQFRYMYLQTQRISLEGNFDQYFATYAPNYYKIDTLGFITPEVMQAFIAAADFDIELVRDHIFLYGPLVDSAEYNRIEQVGKNLAQAINDNIDTYRDSHIAGPERIKNVTPFARRLLKSPIKAVAGLLGSFIALIVLTYFGVTASPGILISEWAFVIYIYVVLNGWRTYKILTTNKQATQSFFNTQEVEKKILQQRKRSFYIRKKY